jgi:flavin-dependent dehydrogenase
MELAERESMEFDVVIVGARPSGLAATIRNVPRIKGSHNAVLSGVLAADRLAAAIAVGRSNDESVEI